MSTKSILQIILLLLIFLIIGSIYYVYFYQKSAENNIVIGNLINEIENTNIQENEGADQQILEDVNKDQMVEIKTEDKMKIENQVKLKENKVKFENSNDLKNLTKEIKYVTTNDAGDIFEIIAEFGKTNLDNSKILDLEFVNGKILSSERSNIYIKSDFAQYNYTNQNSKFFNNVEIKYDNKTIICDSLDLNITENIAIAYSNVKVKDEKSVMQAQVITMDIITKDIEINSEDKIKIFVK